MGCGPPRLHDGGALAGERRRPYRTVGQTRHGLRAGGRAAREDANWLTSRGPRPGGGTMDRKWLPLNALRAFEAAGQHLSFTAAANSLTVAQSAVSRHVIVLENFLGVALFERRPQQLVLTEAGRHILPVVSKSFDRIDQALGEVIKEKGRPKRVLKVALPTSFAHRLPIPNPGDFPSEKSGISLEIVSKPTTGPDVDGDIDIAIVYSEPRVTDAIHDLLWMVRSTILCSPKLLQGLGVDRADPPRLIAS